MEKYKYKIVYGNRRLEACRKLGMKKIEAKVNNEDTTRLIYISDIAQTGNIRTETDIDLAGLMSSIRDKGLLEPIGICDFENTNDSDFLIINASENIHRKDISPIELGRVACLLYENHNMAISEIAAKFNIPETRVKTYINVFKNLPEEFRKMVGSSSGGSPKKGKITPTVINEIMNNRCFTKAQQQILFKRVQKDDISQQQIRLIKELKNAGMLFDEALQEYKNYKMYRCSVPLHIEETDKFMKKNKITTQFRLILHLVSGAVHGQSNLLGHKIKNGR